MSIRTVLLICSMLLAINLGGCASNSVITLMETAQHSNLVIPDQETVNNHMKGRAFRVGKVAGELEANRSSTDSRPFEAVPRLLQQQLLIGFGNAVLDAGSEPALQVDLIVEEMKFTKGKLLIPDPSILRVRMEIRDVDNRLLLQGPLESRYMPAIPIILPGVVSLLPTGFEGQELTAMSKMIPAMAIAITRTVQGLQRGYGLDKIEVFPDAMSVAGVIMPDAFLKGSPYGLSVLSISDLQ